MISTKLVSRVKLFGTFFVTSQLAYESLDKLGWHKSNSQAFANLTNFLKSQSFIFIS